MYLNG
jgi:hypothetical protein